MSVEHQTESIYFHEFTSLCLRLGEVASSKGSIHPVHVFERWISDIRKTRRLSSDTGYTVIRLLFPNHDETRRYDMREKRLCKLLLKIFSDAGICEVDTASVASWASGQDSSGLSMGRSGSLAAEMKRVLNTASRTGAYTGRGRTIAEIDTLLDELALHCKYSQIIPQEEGPRPQLEILRDLYRFDQLASPDEAAIMTQVILRDLLPILEPLRSPHTTRNLSAKSHETKHLSLTHALKIWDPRLPEIYRVHSTFRDEFAAIESDNRERITPTVGIPVQIPRCYKGRSCADALKQLQSATHVYCETKYDGERMQIHINLSLPHAQQIQIFSKSNRNSTMDRYATLEIIRAALRMSQGSCKQPGLQQRLPGDAGSQGFDHTLILEAEMVAFSERTSRIDEFWRIRDLISETAKSIRRKPRPRLSKTRDIEDHGSPTDGDNTVGVAGSMSPQYSHSLESNGTDEGHRHFMIIFFDVLLVDGQSLLHETYDTRRDVLQTLITEVDGYSRIASRTAISMRKGDPCRALESILSTSISRFEEGLVLKADISTYNSGVLPWVKLKRDYIPGLADCIDMAVIGASWDKERARELRVGTDTFTTFYVAVLTDKGTQEKPDLDCVFTTSYGLSKEHLERLNFDIKFNSPIPFERREKVPYTFQLCPGLDPPSVLFKKPMLFELFGAGFDKPAGSKYYAIRWPRVAKYFSAKERVWTECETVKSYTEKAYAAVGRDASEKVAQVQVANMWQVSPGVSPDAWALIKRRAIEQDMRKRLRGNGKPGSKEPNSTFGRSGDVSLVPGPSKILPYLDHHPDPLQLLTPSGYLSDSTQSPRKRRRIAKGDGESDEINMSVQLAPPQPSSLLQMHEEMESTEEFDQFSTVAVDSRTTSVMPPSPFTFLATSSSKKQRLYLEPLLVNAFIFVDRPIYPRPVRAPGSAPANLGLQTSRMVSTLEAFLVAITGSVRLAEMKKPIDRGIIFTEYGRASALVSRLESCHEQLGLGLDISPEILVVPMCYFDMYRSRVTARLLVDVIWRSHQ